ncbi:MAG: hypothetical protein V3U15_05395 [Nitrospinota bacterium]
MIFSCICRVMRVHPKNSIGFTTLQQIHEKILLYKKSMKAIDKKLNPNQEKK